MFLFSGIGIGLLGIFTLCILRWSQFFSSCRERCLWNWRQENSIQCFQNFISFANYCKYYYCRDLIFRMFGNLQGEFENLMYFVWFRKSFFIPVLYLLKSTYIIFYKKLSSFFRKIASCYICTSSACLLCSFW